jgi:hypothetical protein
LDEASYHELVDQLHEVIGDAPFWTIEEFWQPS